MGGVERNAPEPTELVYVPEPTWQPAFVAVGLTLVLLGLFLGWVPIVVGAVLVLAALHRWHRGGGLDMQRLPRHQRPTAAVLPAAPLRRPSRG